MTGIVTDSQIALIRSGSLMRATPPDLRMSAGTRSSAMTAHAPASSAILAWSEVTTSMITPPLSICASPRLTAHVLSERSWAPAAPFAEASETTGRSEMVVMFGSSRAGRCTSWLRHRIPGKSVADAPPRRPFEHRQCAQPDARQDVRRAVPSLQWYAVPGGSAQGAAEGFLRLYGFVVRRANGVCVRRCA